jgi:DNA-binding CsgD family transcriptional regulator
MGTESARYLAAAARAASHLARGEPQEAIEHLRWIESGFRANALAEPNLVRWQPDLVEAYVRLGRPDEARAALATLAEQAFRGGGGWARAAACRGRGMVDADFDRHFGEAIALHEHDPSPLERARTRLAYGSRLRRAGRRTESRQQLERALSAFDELGARPWARQAREELAASGARVRPRARDAAEGLTPRELQVATSVAKGLTNREVAARLFLSEKTVERHLGSVYRKLGLRSRTELAARVARRGTVAR